MFRKFVSSSVAAAFLVGLFATLNGCNTMEGVGKDVEKGGQKIEKEAAENKRY